MEDNRPLFQLTVAEFRRELAAFFDSTKNVEPQKQIETQRKKINGIRGLAKYLEVSAPTAQRIKNQGKIPFYESGNRVYFFSDEIDNGLKVGGLKK